MLGTCLREGSILALVFGVFLDRDHPFETSWVIYVVVLSIALFMIGVAVERFRR